MKTVNTDTENLHIFLTTWGTSMKFWGKMWLIIVLKVTKKQVFTLSLKDTFLEKPKTIFHDLPLPHHHPPFLGLKIT